ncbi:MAG: hypothetical protein E5W06_00395 [Mesorhizobium sp.]|nr:MAG: hypothetical protein E5W06_00395 [Mesorhizobium sp.]
MNEALLNAFRFHFRNATAGYINANCAKAGPAKWAIAAARQDVAAGKARYPRGQYAAVTWQPRDDSSRRAERLAFVEDVAGAGLRFVGKVEADTPRGQIWSDRDSCGWYSDLDQSETIYGVVYQLPGRDGKARFVAGYASDDDCDGLPTLDLGHIFESDSCRGDYYGNVQEHDDARDAARAADSMAQRAAEQEREYKAAWQAGQRYSELADEIAADRKVALELLSERRAARGNGATFPAICATIRQRVAEIMHGIADARAKREKLAEGDFISDWLPSWNSSDKRLQAAFNDGAGQTIFTC